MPSSGAAQLDRLFIQVRQRLRLREALLRMSLWAVLTSSSAATLLLLAAVLGPSPAWRPLCGVWFIGVCSLGVGVLFRTAGSYRSDESVARHIGQRVPDLRSDLLSAVQLAHELRGPLPPYLSPASVSLIQELYSRTAAAATTLSAERLVDLRGVLPRVLSMPLLLFALLVLGSALSPDLWQRGLRNITLPPADPIATSAEPLIGDIRLLLTYPRYTGLPQRSIPGSSGEVLALPGTLVRIEARALFPVERAQMVLFAGDRPPVTTSVQISRSDKKSYPLLNTSFTVTRPGYYAFTIDRAHNDRVRESEGHRIEIEPDHPPRIDLFAPAEDLEISASRRVELAYSAEDDFGLGEIDLCFRVGDGPEQRKRIRSAPPQAEAPEPAAARTAAAKIEWDLAELDLQPGVRVNYHLEARDLDNVSGPNTGSSRTYTLRISSPREKHDAMLARHEALDELMVQLLGDRIELTREAREGSADLRQEGVPEAILSAHRKTEALLLQIGRMQEDLPADSMGPKDLRPALQEIGRRLGKLTQDEEQVLSDLRARRGPEGGKRPGRPARGKDKDLGALSDRHIAELERDTILLDDLLGRQRLEELLSISDEMAVTRDRLRQLLAEYKKTRSSALKNEIEREVRELERRMAELAEKAQRLRGELPEEFLNSEAMGRNDMQSRLDRLRDLLQKGEIDKAQAELERLSQSLDGLIKGMEGDLRGFRRERFTAEDKALGEIEDRLADLSHDEEMVKRQTEEQKAQAGARARQLLHNRADQLTRRLQEKVARLRKQVSDLEVGALGPWGSDELEKTQKRVDDVGRMLDQGDLDEARAMAQEAEQSIGKLIDELRTEEQAARFAARAHLGKSRTRLEQARPMARELMEEIARALPRSEELLTPEDRKLLQDLRAQQEAIRRRTEQLSRDIQKRTREVKDAPLLERLSQDMGDSLHKAGGHMEQAEQELKQMAPRNAASAEGQALDRLSQMRKQMQQARRPRDEGAGARLDRDPVKIPGADEYHAPREFRQDILEAAKREAPTEYRDQVKRYYEELVK